MAHLDRGGRVFLPQWRMRRRRWEESVAHAQCKREGVPAILVPFECACGSINCLGDFYRKLPRQEAPVRMRVKKRKRLTLT